MFHKIVILFVAGAIGLWLCLWDFIDFLTQGLNYNIWDSAILVSGFPSIATGVCILIGVSILGVSVIKG